MTKDTGSAEEPVTSWPGGVRGRLAEKGERQMVFQEDPVCGVERGHLRHREKEYVEKSRCFMVQEDIVEAALKQKGMPEVCEVAFIIFVNIFQLVFLNPAMRGIKEIMRKTKNKQKNTLKSGLWSKSLQSKYMVSSTLESYRVHKHMKGSAKSCNKTSCLKCLKSIYPKKMAPPCTYWMADSFGNTGLYPYPTLCKSILACK